MIDLFTIENFLDDATLDDVREEMRRAGGAPATVLGAGAPGMLQLSVRKTTRVDVHDAIRQRIATLLMDRKAQIEKHFALHLGSCEPPQFLRYGEGDYFVPHQDGNTPMLHDDSRFRRISAVLFLSTPAADPQPDTYGGGALVFHGSRSEPELRVPVTPPPGTLVTFRSETTHEVTPVTHGERWTVVSWFRAPDVPA